jgi:hypothetical protein
MQVDAGSMTLRIRGSVFLVSFMAASLSNTIVASPPARHTWPQSQGNPLAIIPAFLDRQHRDYWESTLQLAKQEFVVFLYRDAAVVYSEAEFVNTGSDTLRVELGLPSTGFITAEAPGEQDFSSGIRDVQLWMARERVEPALHHDGGVDWLTVTPVFTPHVQTRIEALFWMETSVGEDVGDRAIWIPMSQAAIWKDVIESLDVTVVLREGLTADDSLFEADPDNYSVEDSVLTWSFSNIEPGPSEDISVIYNSYRSQALDATARENLSKFIVDRVYGEILEYASEEEE